jgi:hypothetical protein
MRYWADNPELLDQIIYEEMALHGLALGDEEPYEVVQKLLDTEDGWKIAVEAERKYWVDRL